MIKLGYHISHEQFAPSELLQYVQKAEDAGFQFALSSDHFYTWSENQGNCGFAWSWLGAALQATKKMRFGIVNCPSYRYHPAIIAQAVATLLEMYPKRFWVAFGSGQAINEAIKGEKWPIKEERNKILKESVDIIKQMWKGETVTHHGLVKVEEARLHTFPSEKPRVIGAAITPETAGWLANWADGLITISQPKEKLEKVVEAWKKGGGEGKPMILKVQLSYDQDKEEALKGAHDQWKTNIFDSEMLEQLRTPKQFDMAADKVKPEDVAEVVNVSSDPLEHVKWLKEYAELGFRELVLHNVNRKQEQFIEVFGEKVLPEFYG